MTSNRMIVCPICSKEIEVRSAFAHQTLMNHLEIAHKDREVK
jgi:hypothetical protein